MIIRSKLLALPAEIRIQIYENIFHFEIRETELVNAKPPCKGIHLSCRQAYAEARRTYRRAYRTYWRYTPFYIRQEAQHTFDHLRDEDIEHIENIELRANWTPPIKYLVAHRDLITLLYISLGYPDERTTFIARRDRTRQLWFCAPDDTPTGPCKFPSLNGDWELAVTVEKAKTQVNECETEEDLVLRGVMRPVDPTHPRYFLRSLFRRPKLKIKTAPLSRPELEAIAQLGTYSGCG